MHLEIPAEYNGKDVIINVTEVYFAPAEKQTRNCPGFDAVIEVLDGWVDLDDNCAEKAVIETQFVAENAFDALCEKYAEAIYIAVAENAESCKVDAAATYAGF